MEPRCLAEIRAGDCHLFNKIPIVCNDYFQVVYMSGGVCIKVLWSTWQILTEYLLETCIIIINWWKLYISWWSIKIIRRLLSKQSEFWFSVCIFAKHPFDKKNKKCGIYSLFIVKTIKIKFYVFVFQCLSIKICHFKHWFP